MRLGLAVLSLAVLGAACQGPQSPSQTALQAWIGTNLADVVVTTLAGNPQTLAQAGQGRPMVVNVWATWCPPCVIELPSLSELAEKSSSLTVVAIATDAKPETVTEFLSKHPISSKILVLHDPLGRITREQLGAIGLPTTLVTNASGTVVLAEAGERNWSHFSMLDKIRAALARK